MGCHSSVAPYNPIQCQTEKQTCHLCNEIGSNLPRLTCTHYFHEICLFQKRISTNQCACGTVIGQLNNISQNVHQLLLAHQAQKIAQKNQNQLYQVFHCPKKGCSFYFIQVKKLELSQNKEFFCDQCNCMVSYDYELQKSDYTNEKSNAGANQIQVLSQQSTKSSKDQYHSQQLQKLIETIQLPIKYCKNNCGFLYIENDSQDICNSLCQNCSFCNKCNRLLFSHFISIKNCQHKFHFLCAYTLIEVSDKLESLKCNCGEVIDDEDIKIKLNINCMICKKYDKHLKQFPCQHYIHLDCIYNNSIQFIEFKCYICNIPILDFLSLPQHNYINDQIKKSIKMLEQIKTDCFICLKQSEEPLFNTSCNHKVHYSCLRKKQAEIYEEQQLLKCGCGQQIINICQIIR